VHLHDLRSPDGARKKAKRVGRGTGSGRGKTSGRGQKGQRARGTGFRIGFEGGQMPLHKRLPKLPGFTNPFKKSFAVVNLTRLNRFPDGYYVTPVELRKAGVVDDGVEIKILATGKLKRKLTVEAHAASEAARAAIEAAGGSLTLLESKQKTSAGQRKRARERAEKDEAASSTEE
jgi:large subunit ribosomal protein L15